MKNLTKPDKEYLEHILSMKFHDPSTEVKEMSKIVRISQLLGINTESNDMKRDLEFTKEDLLSKMLGNNPNDELIKIKL